MDNYQGCDRCGTNYAHRQIVRAKHVVDIPFSRTPSELERLRATHSDEDFALDGVTRMGFCGHHWNKHKDAILAVAVSVDGEAVEQPEEAAEPALA